MMVNIRQSQKLAGMGIVGEGLTELGELGLGGESESGGVVDLEVLVLAGDCWLEGLGCAEG
jgi:hypothetical protein